MNKKQRECSRGVNNETGRSAYPVIRRSFLTHRILTSVNIWVFPSNITTTHLDFDGVFVVVNVKLHPGAPKSADRLALVQ